MAIKRSFILSSGLGISANDLYIVGSTASTNSTTGALIVTGGAGIAKSLSIGGRLQLFNGANYTAFVSSASGNTVYTLPATSPATGSSVLQSDTAGVMSWVPMVASASSGATATNVNVVSATTSASHRVLFTPASGTASGAALSSESTFVYNPSTDILSVSGLAITSGTASTNPTNGALVVAGGVGISGSLYVGSSSDFSPVPEEFTVAGFAKSADNIYFVIKNSNTDPAFDTSAANIILAHSDNYAMIGIGKTVADNGALLIHSLYSGITLYAGGQILISSEQNIYHNTEIGFDHRFGVDGINAFSIASTGATFYNTTASTASTNGALQVSGGVGIGKTSYFGQDVKIQGSTASLSPTTGALTVTGGAGIGQSVSVGGRLQMFNSSNYTAFVSSASGNTVYTLPATSPATGSSVLQSTSAGVMSWVPMTATGGGSGTTSANVNIVAAGASNLVHSILFTPVSSSSGSAISSDSTISFNPSTEILNVSGLAVTSGTASTNTTTGALVVRGGLGVTGQLSFVSASFGFTGVTTNPSMSFIGATSSSPITLTVLTDNSLNWEGSQGSVFSIDSNLSTGEIFSVSDISGLPIISASAGQTVIFNEFGGYTRFGNGSISSTGASNANADGSLVVYGGIGITGNANIGGTVRITNTTVSSSSSSGALVISGGVGIGGTLNIGADLSISGLTTLTYTSEKLNTKTSAGAAGTVTHDLSTGSIFYHSSISNNFTANITNVPTTNDRAIGVTLVLAQGVTAYMSTALQIDGSAQTIKWVNNSTPAGTASKVDIVGFSLIRTGSAWTVLGQYSTYG